MPRAGAARPEERGVQPPPFEEHAADEQDRVAGEDAELDGQEGDPAAGHEDGPSEGRQERRQPCADGEVPVGRQGGPQPVAQRRDARPHAVDPLDAHRFDVGPGPPLDVELADARSGDVGRRDDERPADRLGSVRLDAVELERVRQPVRIGAVRSPKGGDLEVEPGRLVERIDDRQPVAEVEAEGTRGRLGDRRLDRAPSRYRPMARRQLGVPFDPGIRGDERAVGVAYGRAPDDLHRIGPGDLVDLAAAGPEHLREHRSDRRIERDDVARRRGRPGEDARVRGARRP